MHWFPRRTQNGSTDPPPRSFGLDVHARDGRAYGGVRCDMPQEGAAQKTARREIGDGIDQADDAGDKGTADLFTEISREIDKYLWFVEAHQQK